MRRSDCTASGPWQWAQVLLEISRPSHASAVRVSAAAWGAGAVVANRALLVVYHSGDPQFLAGGGIDGGQLAIETPDEDPAGRIGHAAVVDVAAGVLQHIVRNFRFICPFALAGRGIDGINVFRSPGCTDINRVTDDNRR